MRWFVKTSSTFVRTHRDNTTYSKYEDAPHILFLLACSFQRLLTILIVAVVDRNSPGVLQDRLNRDANELGNNIVRFPARNASRITHIITVVVQLFMYAPRRLLVPALIPMFIMSMSMRYLFKVFNRMQQRERRVEEESIKTTSEVLREIKTVRQFAMESKEAANYGGAGLARHFMVQKASIIRVASNTMLWDIFDSMLVLTMYMGFPYVQSGQLSVSGASFDSCALLVRVAVTDYTQSFLYQK